MPTPYEIVDWMLVVAEVRASNVLYDRECGDGRMVIAAAKQNQGTRGGVEFDPVRIREARANAQQTGVGGMVAFQVADLFETDVGEATLVIQGTPLRWESSGGWRRMQATELSNLP